MLAPQEREVLDRYSNLQQAGDLNGRTVKQISGIHDIALGREYGGAGTVAEAAKAINTDGVELPFFIMTRPYLFFANPANGDFYFMRNTNAADPANFDVEVLDMATRQWVRVDNTEQFFGDEYQGTSENYPGLIKANFVVAQFSQDAGRVLQERDEIDLRVSGESLGPKARGEKYFQEHQKSGYCQIHAANAFLGYPAVRPNALAEYIATRAVGFDFQNVEGLAAGGHNLDFNDTAEELANGIDLGEVIGYLQHAEAEGLLKEGVSLNEIKVGKLSYSDEGGLMFTNDMTGDEHRVDDQFLAAHSRTMIGTYAPVHAMAARKNTDGSWSEVDSIMAGQKVNTNFTERLIEKIQTQQATQVGNITMPCAFM